MNTDQATNATPEAVCSTAQLGPAPEGEAFDLHDCAMGYAYTESTDPAGPDDWSTDDVVKAFKAGYELAQRQQRAAVAAERERAKVQLAACMASRGALRDWAQECRDQVLYLLAQRNDELGRLADGLGQASVGLLGPNAAGNRLARQGQSG